MFMWIQCTNAVRISFIRWINSFIGINQLTSYFFVFSAPAKYGFSFYLLSFYGFALEYSIVFYILFISQHKPLFYCRAAGGGGGDDGGGDE